MLTYQLYLLNLKGTYNGGVKLTKAKWLSERISFLVNTVFFA
jgi:hypothetical protein